MNAQTRISAKGQVVIPKDVRDRMSWSEGERLDVIETSCGVLLRRHDMRRRITVEEFKRLVPPHDGPAVSLEEMNEGIDQALQERWAAKDARSR